jgi:hypothetical protein
MLKRWITIFKTPKTEKSEWKKERKIEDLPKLTTQIVGSWYKVDAWVRGLGSPEEMNPKTGAARNSEGSFRVRPIEVHGCRDLRPRNRVEVLSCLGGYWMRLKSGVGGFERKKTNLPTILICCPLLLRIVEHFCARNLQVFVFKMVQ